MSSNSRLTIAVHALCWLELSRRRGNPTLTSAEIADSLLSHPVLLRRTLAPLRDAGLLEVVGRGPGTGWRLARPAEEISLREVNDLLGDDQLFALHPHPPKQDCPVGFGIPPTLAEVYEDVEGAVAEALARHTVADVLDRLLREHPLPA
ncbi:Rrf2 family transcriptional regulator [Nocardioides antri]|uniref:Rrf2 family transcriptional regulator n=1 Tax=Nocardioides antri TaxID=2607659 RepID=A0A5B1M1V0_9ACTN|nr:Rrf2 family transcriptional regulator [Nocardioides antri]KAA1425787.1 Rrf2 family transcriptional regulator [Nocardioides antri]